MINVKKILTEVDEPLHDGEGGVTDLLARGEVRGRAGLDAINRHTEWLVAERRVEREAGRNGAQDEDDNSHEGVSLDHTTVADN